MFVNFFIDFQLAFWLKFGKKTFLFECIVNTFYDFSHLFYFQNLLFYDFFVCVLLSLNLFDFFHLLDTDTFASENDKKRRSFEVDLVK